MSSKPCVNLSSAPNVTLTMRQDRLVFARLATGCSERCQIATARSPCQSSSHTKVHQRLKVPAGQHREALRRDHSNLEVFSLPQTLGEIFTLLRTSAFKITCSTAAAGFACVAEAQLLSISGLETTCEM